MPSLWLALCDVVLFWIRQGVRIFRVDNPHTKPFPFWEWLIAEIQTDHPDTIFLADAFTRPKLIKRLARLGFTQSYSYFTWRNSKAELTDYLTELTGEECRHYMRPNFFANTPDINPYFLQSSGRFDFASGSFLLFHVNLDPHGAHDFTFELPLWELGLPDDAEIEARDLLHGNHFVWRGRYHRLTLDPDRRPYAIWQLLPPERAQT